MLTVAAAAERSCGADEAYVAASAALLSKHSSWDWDVRFEAQFIDRPRYEYTPLLGIDPNGTLCHRNPSGAIARNRGPSFTEMVDQGSARERGFAIGFCIDLPDARQDIDSVGTSLVAATMEKVSSGLARHIGARSSYLR